MKTAVFDIEIKKTIEQCSHGWQSHDEMGVSVLCLYDYVTQRYRVFDDKNMDEALHTLHNYDIVVGFNSVNFDWKVLNATYHYQCQRKSTDFDILREIWLTVGLNPDKFEPTTHGGYKLDDIASETIGLRKTGSGAHAPELYQQGRYAELIDYCLQDVRITKLLYDFIRKYGYVVRNSSIIPLEVK